MRTNAKEKERREGKVNCLFGCGSQLEEVLEALYLGLRETDLVPIDENRSKEDNDEMVTKIENGKKS